jgi:hypothetical protein
MMLREGRDDFVAQSHTPRNRCVRFVFSVTAASRNTRLLEHRDIVDAIATPAGSVLHHRWRGSRIW